jgi:hypothetical protein
MVAMSLKVSLTMGVAIAAATDDIGFGGFGGSGGWDWLEAWFGDEALECWLPCALGKAADALASNL